MNPRYIYAWENTKIATAGRASYIVPARETFSRLQLAAHLLPAARANSIRPSDKAGILWRIQSNGGDAQCSGSVEGYRMREQWKRNSLSKDRTSDNNRAFDIKYLVLNFENLRSTVEQR